MFDLLHIEIYDVYHLYVKGYLPYAATLPYNPTMPPDRFNVRLDEEMKENRVLERLRAIGKKRKRSVSFLIREALLEYVEAQERGELDVD
jgi:hypothetical protein